MALYVLNGSVDAPDFHSERVSEDLAYNDQESALEILVEQVLGFENAIAEYDDNDATRHTALKKNTFSYYFLLHHNTGDGLHEPGSKARQTFRKYYCFMLTSVIEVHSPPPEVYG